MSVWDEQPQALIMLLEQIYAHLVNNQGAMPELSRVTVTFDSYIDAEEFARAFIDMFPKSTFPTLHKERLRLVSFNRDDWQPSKFG